MIRVVRAEERHFRDRGWLQTYWLFSFENYYDPNNVRLGALRVFNDDTVASGRGFPPHTHSDMEIVTIPLSGQLTHRDSTGNEGTIGPGEVQAMSAGIGITHSEWNDGDQPVHLYQIWILPNQVDLPPTYEQTRFEPESWRNRLLPVASGQGYEGAVTINADATIYRSELDADQSIDYAADPARRVLIYITHGAMRVNDTALNQGDQARIGDETGLRISSVGPVSFILIDVPEVEERVPSR